MDGCEIKGCVTSWRALVTVVTVVEYLIHHWLVYHFEFESVVAQEFYWVSTAESECLLPSDIEIR